MVLITVKPNTANHGLLKGFEIGIKVCILIIIKSLNTILRR